MHLGTSLGYVILDRLLGGDGVPLEKSREFSEIELAIIQKILVMFHILPGIPGRMW